jgi:hypothetical protein
MAQVSIPTDTIDWCDDWGGWVAVDFFGDPQFVILSTTPGDSDFDPSFPWEVYRVAPEGILSDRWEIVSRELFRGEMDAAKAYAYDLLIK